MMLIDQRAHVVGERHCEMVCTISPVVALRQNVMVVAPPPLLTLLAPLLPLPQAVSPAAPITRAADTARDFLSFMSSFLFVESRECGGCPPRSGTGGRC